MKIQYREPTSKEELSALFRLRLETYADDPHLHSMVQKTSQFDINEYDLFALHYAAFENNTPIACIRLSTTSETHFSEWVDDLIQEHDIVLDDKKTSYPFQNYYPDQSWSADFLSKLCDRKIGEVGKLAIHKNHISGGIVLNGLINSFVKYCKVDQNLETGFGSCTHKLERYYRKFGFTVADGSIPFTHGDLPEAVIVRFDK